jgi:hypothetical protein
VGLWRGAGLGTVILIVIVVVACELNPDDCRPYFNALDASPDAAAAAIGTLPGEIAQAPIQKPANLEG